MALVGGLTGPAAGSQAKQPVLSGSRKGLGGSFVARPKERFDARLHAAQLESAVSSISWFTQPERFVSIQQPSKDAKLLERAFWHHPVVDVPSTREEAVVMIEGLQRETEANGLADGTNVVAFTGGNGPALTAYLLDSVFDGAVVGCVGDASLVSEEQREHATYVCDLLGIDLLEVDDTTWSRFGCCGAIAEAQPLSNQVALFSGYTADESLRDSRNAVSGVCSPLSNLSPAAVNTLSKVVGLPISNHIA